VRKRKHKTGVITSLEQVPAGYVQLSRMFSDDDPRRDNRRRMLSDAHAGGYIPAVKMFRTADDHRTGPVFVDSAAAWDYIRTREEMIYVQEADRDEPAAAAQTSQATEELRDLIEVARTLTATIRDLQAAIELHGVHTADDCGGAA
jgi:hypothetical protein